MGVIIINLLVRSVKIFQDRASKIPSSETIFLLLHKIYQSLIVLGFVMVVGLLICLLALRRLLEIEDELDADVETGTGVIRRRTRRRFEIVSAVDRREMGQVGRDEEFDEVGETTPLLLVNGRRVDLSALG